MYGFHAQPEGSFDQVIDAVTEALKTEGFGVLSDIDVAATFKAKLDIEPLIFPVSARDAMTARDENDDALMEKYFESEILSDEEIASGLAKALASCKVVPVGISTLAFASGPASIVAGNSAMVSSLSRANTTMLSRQLRSCRTLPGQG